MRQVAPHWQVAVEVNGRTYVAMMGLDPDGKPRVNAVGSEFNRKATRRGKFRRGSLHVVRWLAPEGPTWKRVEAAISAMKKTPEA